jgi:5-methylcytosine-specific restriction endonuclease McrA
MGAVCKAHRTNPRKRLFNAGALRRGEILGMVTPDIDYIRLKFLEIYKKHKKDTSRAVKEFMLLYPDASRELIHLYNYTHNDGRNAYTVSYRQKRYSTNGSHTKDEWDGKVEEYDHKCCYCGREMERLTKDHVHPISMGGTDYIDNIVPACKSCNSRKHTKFISELDDTFKKPVSLKLI